jgi:hypothetical protein
MERLVELNNVKQYGTCFDPTVFDPDSLPEEDFLPQIRRRLEKQVGFDASILSQIGCFATGQLVCLCCDSIL